MGSEVRVRLLCVCSVLAVTSLAKILCRAVGVYRGEPRVRV